MNFNVSSTIEDSMFSNFIVKNYPSIVKVSFITIVSTRIFPTSEAYSILKQVVLSPKFSEKVKLYK